MNEMDGRKLSHAALEEIRIRAVRRVEAGESPEMVIEALGFHRSTIYCGDEASIRSDTRGGTTWAPTGETPVVSKPPAHGSASTWSPR